MNVALEMNDVAGPRTHRRGEVRGVESRPDLAGRSPPRTLGGIGVNFGVRER
jgi:hypothetical protein